MKSCLLRVNLLSKQSSDEYSISSEGDIYCLSDTSSSNDARVKWPFLWPPEGTLASLHARSTCRKATFFCIVRTGDSPSCKHERRRALSRASRASPTVRLLSMTQEATGPAHLTLKPSIFSVIKPVPFRRPFPANKPCCVTLPVASLLTKTIICLLIKTWIRVSMELSRCSIL